MSMTRGFEQLSAGMHTSRSATCVRRMPSGRADARRRNAGIRRTQALAEVHRVGAGQGNRALALVGQRKTAGAQPHVNDAGIRMRGRRSSAPALNGSSAGRSASGVPSTRTSRLTGTLSGRDRATRADEAARSEPSVLAHADDAAAADRDACLADARKSRAVAVGAGRDDAAVKTPATCRGCGVRGQSCIGQRVGLFLRQHAERDARFHTETADGAHHLQHLIELLAPGTSRHAAPMQNRVAPCSRARVAASVSLRDRHELAARDAGLVVRRLRTVRAILRASAGFDAEQHAALHLVGPVMRAMQRLRAEHEIGQRRGVDRLDFGKRPVVAEWRRRGHDLECSKKNASKTSSATTMVAMTMVDGPLHRHVGLVFRPVVAAAAIADQRLVGDFSSTVTTLHDSEVRMNAE